MRMVLVGFTLATFMVGTPAHTQTEEPAKTLDGKWELIAQQYDGGPAFACENSSMTFTSDKVVLVQRGKQVSYSYIIDAKARPREIDLVALDDPFKGKTFEAIFVVDGDKLTINMGGLPGVKRPTQFGTQKENGTRHWAFALKRIKE